MAMVCDPDRTPEPGGPFPLGTGTEDYDYTRTFLVYAQAVTMEDGLIDDLVIDIRAVNEPGPAGTPKADATWQEQLRKLLELRVPPLPARQERLYSPSADKAGEEFALADRTPLDFAVYEKTCIILRLVGDFWSFRHDHPATTKRNLGNHYYNLERHELVGSTIQTPARTSDFQCISFFCGLPCLDGQNVRHGLNLHVDLVMMANGNEERLPIVIDPDIENKGGNPLLLYARARQVELA